MDPQPLSTVINAPIISSFLSSDPNHLSIFDTLLESRIMGIDSEIRSEYENGTATRFPVLILCLDGLERLLEKHGRAKELLEEKIQAEDEQAGIYGQVVESLPVARTSALVAGGETNGEELEVLRKKLEVEYAEESKKLKERLDAEYTASNAKLKEEMERSCREQLAKRENELQADAAQELAKLKTEVLMDATKDVARQRDGLAEEFARREKVREENAADQLAKEKEKLEKNAGQELVKLKEALRNKAAGDINEWKREMRAKNEEEMAKLRNKLQNDAREELTRLMQERRSEKGKYSKNLLKKVAAEALEKLKEDLRIEAAADLNEWRRQIGTKNSEEIAKSNNELSAEQLSKEKENLEIGAAKELSTLQTDLAEKAAKELEQIRAKLNDKVIEIVEEYLANHNREFLKRMDLNRKNFGEFKNKSTHDIGGVRVTDGAAVKLLAKSPTIFNKYKDLCVDALKAYKRDLKEQYQNYLTEIELECRVWLRQNSASKLKIEVMEGLRKTIERGASVAPMILPIGKDVGDQITSEDLQQEVNEIMAEFEAQQQKSVLEGGLGLPLVDAQAEATKLGIKDTDMLAVVENLQGSSAEESFLVTAVKELQAKAQQATSAENFNMNLAQPKTRSEHVEPAISNTAPENALGKPSSRSQAANLEGAELRERQVNIEQELHQKNDNSPVNEIGPPKLQPTTSWPYAKENVLTPTANVTQVINVASKGTVQARTEPKARYSRSAGKKSEAKLTVENFRDANQGNSIKSSIPSILQLDLETETQEAPEDFPLVNKRVGGRRVNQGYTIKSNIPSILQLDMETGTRERPGDFPHGNVGGSATRMEAESLMVPRPSREAAPEPTMETSQRENETDENSKLAEMESRVEEILQLEPLASQALTTKQKIFETRYSGKTVSEIYEILQIKKHGKRKRLPDSGSDEMPLRKKTDQQTSMKK